MRAELAHEAHLPLSTAARRFALWKHCRPETPSGVVDWGVVGGLQYSWGNAAGRTRSPEGRRDLGLRVQELGFRAAEQEREVTCTSAPSASFLGCRFLQHSPQAGFSPIADIAVRGCGPDGPVWLHREPDCFDADQAFHKRRGYDARDGCVTGHAGIRVPIHNTPDMGRVSRGWRGPRMVAPVGRADGSSPGSGGRGDD